ncbi:BQ5605_C001g00012 [Microbotryum silenes-dioicae]|uniref:BQ5605_C001g00012 protein n=1 Tax=Microbotryum silenes-dioicae TaxID=796604 RepID=A0A2X0MPF1_9BASI|nr:BQ5605_C001g00012 [Microbotryum silenes-dioicae]
MREKGARHLPSSIAAAFRVSAPRHRNTTGKVITLEDDEDEDDDEWRKKMSISTCRHVEVCMSKLGNFMSRIKLICSDQIKIRSIKAESEKSRSDLI